MVGTGVRAGRCHWGAGVGVLGPKAAEQYVGQVQQQQQQQQGQTPRSPSGQVNRCYRHDLLYGTAMQIPIVRIHA